MTVAIGGPCRVHLRQEGANHSGGHPVVLTYLPAEGVHSINVDQEVQRGETSCLFADLAEAPTPLSILSERTGGDDRRLVPIAMGQYMEQIIDVISSNVLCCGGEVGYWPFRRQPIDWRQCVNQLSNDPRRSARRRSVSVCLTFKIDSHKGSAIHPG
ncbi:hypothetical protein [Kitasatospora purpeofusca]|uniref:hypothetical protein n=1 Tax=Kitasatospora purpeofusca TaxID=67352 RepID=UPI0036574709